jgi:hypothetical protein
MALKMGAANAAPIERLKFCCFAFFMVARKAHRLLCFFVQPKKPLQSTAAFINFAVLRPMQNA